MKPIFMAAICCLLPTTLQAQTNYQQLWAFAASLGAPTTPLIEGTDGNLYGAGASMVFELNKHGGGFRVFRLLTGIGANCLVQGADGVLYGTTDGMVFRLNPDGSGYRVLHSFGASSTDGKHAEGQLVASDKKLYGTTWGGGSSDLGTVFAVADDGSGYEILHSFTVADLKEPQGGLAKATNGVLYGMTSYGFITNDATWLAGGIFKLNQDGTGYAVLRSFHATGGDASSPCSGLVQGSDGKLYGTTSGGGSNNLGTVFRMNLDGSGYRIIRSFKSGDGSSPGRLIEGADGALYGVESDGGSRYEGAVFKLRKDGSGYSTLYSFTLADGDGFSPQTALLQASDGALYGTTFYGGMRDINSPLGYGTVFKVFSRAPQITITRLQFAGGNARLTLSGGSAGQTYYLQSKANLNTAEGWQTIGSATAGIDGAFQFLDTGASNQTARFYRSAAP